MKKILAFILTILMVLSAGIPAAFAVPHGRNYRKVCVINEDCYGICKGTEAGKGNDLCRMDCMFADADNDSICDNCKNICGNCNGKTDENGDSICDKCGTCGHFADENGDGLCDTCGKQPVTGSNPAGDCNKHHNSGNHYRGGHKGHH